MKLVQVLDGRRAAARSRRPGVGRGRRVRDLPPRPERAGGARRARRCRVRVADGADERRGAADRRSPSTSRTSPIPGGRSSR